MDRQIRFSRLLLMLISMSIGEFSYMHADPSGDVVASSANQQIDASPAGADPDLGGIISGFTSLFSGKKVVEKEPDLSVLPSDVSRDIKENLALCENFLSQINAIPYYVERCKNILNDVSPRAQTVSYAKNLHVALNALIKDLGSGALIQAATQKDPSQGPDIRVSPAVLIALLNVHKATLLEMPKDSCQQLLTDIDDVMQLLAMVEKRDVTGLNKLSIDRIRPLYGPIRDALNKTLSEKIEPLKASLAQQPRVPSVIQQEKVLAFYEGELRTTLNTTDAFFGNFDHSINLDWMLSVITVLFQFWDYFEDSTLWDFIQKPFSENYTEEIANTSPLGQFFLYGIPGALFRAVKGTIKSLYDTDKKKLSYMLIFRVVFAGASSVNFVGSNHQSNLLSYLYGDKQVYKRDKTPGVDAQTGEKGVIYDVKSFINPFNTAQVYASALFQGVVESITQFPSAKYKLNFGAASLYGAKALTVILWQFIKGDITNLWPAGDDRVKKLTRDFLASFVCQGIFNSLADSIQEAIPTQVHEWSKSLSLGVLDFEGLKGLFWQLTEPTLLLGIFSPQSIVPSFGNGPLSYLNKFMHDNIANIDESFVFKAGKITDGLSPSESDPIRHYYSYAKYYGYNPYAYFIMSRVVSYGVTQVCRTGCRFIAPLIWKGTGTFLESVHRVYSTLYVAIPKIFNENFEKEVDEQLAVLDDRLKAKDSDLPLVQKEVDENVEDTTPGQRLPVTQLIKEACVGMSASVRHLVGMLLPLLLADSGRGGLGGMFNLRDSYVKTLISQGKIGAKETRIEVISPLVLETAILKILKSNMTGHLVSSSQALKIKKEYKALLMPCAVVRAMKTTEEITQQYKNITVQEVEFSLMERLDPAAIVALKKVPGDWQKVVFEEVKNMTLDQINREANAKLSRMLLEAVKDGIPVWIGDRIADFFVAPFISRAVMNSITYVKVSGLSDLFVKGPCGRKSPFAAVG